MFIAHPLNFLVLSVALVSVSTFAQSPADWPAPRQVDAVRAAAAGIRELTSKHLRLWTDVPANSAVEELPTAFDAAMPQWGKYFGIPEAKWQDWQAQGFLIQDRAKFAALGLLSERNPTYVNGYALGNELWFDEQPSDYYRRHLLLHEGTHSFMLSFLGAGGPGWYMEGMAELLGTHRWQEGKLELNVFPNNKEEFPMWGRIKLIREAVSQGKQLSLSDVLAISNREALSVDAYAWSWALTKFLDSHPRYSEKFRKLDTLVRDRKFNDRFRKMFHKDWNNLEFEWQAFLASLDYGYDLERLAIEPAKVTPLTEAAETTIDTARGWQPTPWLLRKGREYKLAASGRYQIAHDGEAWPSEPGGVTIRYHDGRPLGMLLGTLRSTKSPLEFADPMAIGLGATIAPHEDSVLYLRVNDFPAEMSDNKGQVGVRIEPL
jgi:hypothetical protein